MKIILAVDGSKYSKWAVDLLMKLPLIKMPQIIVLNIVNTKRHIPAILDSMLSKQYKTATQDQIERDIASGEKLTTKIVAKLRTRWNNVTPIIEKGHVADKIIRKADEEKANLIILGSRGISNIKSFLLGGVSQKVVTYASCPVLVVKKKANSFKNVLLPVDGSPSSEFAMSFLKSQFLHDKVRAFLLNVSEFDFNSSEDLVEIINNKKFMSFSTFVAENLFAIGDPAEIITNTASQRKVDLIVIGSKGMSGIKRFFLGSVARKVITYGDCSVLVIKEPENT